MEPAPRPAPTNAPCPNCGASSSGRFCSSCGQDNGEGRLAVRGVLLDAFHNFVNWDSALLATLRGLALRPGHVAREYVEGRRKRYVGPAKLCLYTLALWLLAARWLEVDVLAASGLRVETSGEGGRANELARELREFFGGHLDLLLYLALPLRAWLVTLAFRGRGRNLAECFVLVFYAASASFLLGLVLTPLMAFDSERWMRARQALSFVWAVWAARQFFGVSWGSAFARTTLVTVLHVLGTGLFFALLALPFFW